MLRHEPKLELIIRKPNADELKSRRMQSGTARLQKATSEMRKFLQTPGYEPEYRSQRDELFVNPSRRPVDVLSEWADKLRKLSVDVDRYELVDNPKLIMPLIQSNIESLVAINDWFEWYEQALLGFIRHPYSKSKTYPRREIPFTTTENYTNPEEYVEDSYEQAVLLPIEIRNRSVWLYSGSDLYRSLAY